jgi:hypothetical protein
MRLFCGCCVHCVVCVYVVIAQQDYFLGWRVFIIVHTTPIPLTCQPKSSCQVILFSIYVNIKVMDAAHGTLCRDSKKKRIIPIVLVSVGHYCSCGTIRILPFWNCCGQHQRFLKKVDGKAWRYPFPSLLYFHDEDDLWLRHQDPD